MSKTVLVVDDELCICETLCALLEEEGYHCIRASNGREGLAAADQQKPDLVIVDVMMPLMDGRDMVWAMRANGRYSNVPILMMSAARSAPDHEQTGYDAFLQKPFSIEAVLEQVTRLLNRAVRPS